MEEKAVCLGLMKYGGLVSLSNDRCIYRSLYAKSRRERIRCCQECVV